MAQFLGPVILFVSYQNRLNYVKHFAQQKNNEGKNWRKSDFRQFKYF